MTASEAAQTLVGCSIAYNKIETYKPDTIDAAQGVVDELAVMAEDSAENGPVHEFWGTHDGYSWRVHVVMPATD